MNIVHEAPRCASEAALLLPWFVTGRLEPEDAAQVEAHLAACPACRDDLERQRTLRQRFQDDAGRRDTSGPAFRKLMARIDETERAMPQRRGDVAGTGGPSRVRAPRWLVAAAIVQTVALGALGAALWQQTDDRLAPRYQTLTSPPPATAGPGPQLRIVFAPGTTLHEVAEIFADIDARIVDGPSPAGAYALAFSSGAERRETLTAVLGKLRANDRVVFAEPIQQEPAP